MIGLFLRASRAALLFALAASPTLARELPNVAQTTTSRSLWHPAPKNAQRPAKWLLPKPRRQLAQLPEAASTSPFGSRLTIGMSEPRITVLSWELSGVTASLATVRAKTVRIDGLSSFAHNRFANMEAQASIGAPLGDRDTLILAGTVALERRRPSLRVGAHNQYRNIGRALTLGWIHDKDLRFSLSAFDVHPSGARSEVERFVDFAAGNQRAAKGIDFAIARSASQDPDRLSFGLDFKQQRSEAAYAKGLATYRSETRAAVFLRAKF